VGDGNPLGRRVRYVSTGAGPAESAPWYEIVGVVDDLFATTFNGTMYHPVAPGQMHPASLVLRVGPDVGGVAGRLREMTAALNLSLRVDRIRSMDEIFREQQEGNYLGASALAAVTLSVLLLSAAGMYALMSFTVNQRRREIGIRSALGAQPRRLLAGIFKRALRQLGVGAAVGVLLALLLDRYMPVEQMGGLNVPGIIPAAAAFMMIVGLLAANGPARRGLRVQPTEALRGVAGG
jgi:putative ABC transport system permease protein